MVLTTPMFRAITEHLPAAEIHVLTSPRGLSVIDNNPRIAKRHLHQKKLLVLPRLISRLRAEQFDVWIDPKDHPSGEGSFLASMSGASLKIGFNKPGQRVFAIQIPSAEENFERHAVQRNLLALAALLPGKAELLVPRPELFVDPECTVTLPLHTILINISAGNPSRHWPSEHWSTVINACAQRAIPTALMFDPSDRETAKEIAARGGNSILLDTPTIHHAIAAVSGAACVLSSDTSIVHIAAAFNKPIVALYPRVDWNLKKFRPLSDTSIVVMPEEAQSFRDIPAARVIESLLNIQ